jgi:hypothetical protein
MNAPILYTTDANTPTGVGIGPSPVVVITRSRKTSFTQSEARCIPYR